MDGIGQHNEAAKQAHVPKGNGHLACRFPFRRDPLNDPSREKQALPKKTDAKPHAFDKGQAGKIRADVRKKFAHRLFNRETAVGRKTNR